MVQEVTTKSYGSRIVSAFWGILFGITLIVAAFLLIFWNENQALRTAQSLEQTLYVLISVPNTPIDNKNNSKVVYLNGEATTKNILKDSILEINETAIKLERIVEMYQWQEKVEATTEKEIGGSEKQVKTYTYNPVWSEEIIESDQFKESKEHQNPSQMPISSLKQYAKEVKVGDFNLPADLIKQIDNPTPIDLSHVELASLAEKLDKKSHHNNGSIYLGVDPNTPKIGDLRISSSKVLPQTVSVIAQQTGKTLQPYLAPAGKEVSLLVIGEQSPHKMIQDALSENQLIMWLLRIGSLTIMVFGFALILKPLGVMTDVIPFVGNIVGFGTGLIAFIVGITLWSLATAIAWFTVRPLLAICFIGLVLFLCYALITYKKARIVKP